MFLTNYQSLITLIACALTLFIIYFLDTILAVTLEDEFGLTGDNVGYIYIPAMAFFLIACPVAAYLCNKMEKRVLIALSFFFASIAYFLTGPSELFKLPKYYLFTFNIIYSNIWIMLTGYTLLCGVSALFYIPGLPEVIDVIAKKYSIDATNE